jgi:glycosyltransferase involved in cell wall biosynthesis
MKKILWLTSWYPNERDLFSGDFIQRQAEAVAGLHPVQVIYVGKTASIPAENAKLHLEDRIENLKEFIIYYNNSKNIFSNWRSLYLYFKKNLSIIEQLRRNNELPDLVHVQVAMKAGLIAMYLKWKYNIPYVLTEHWTGYYRKPKDSLFQKSFLERFLTKRILKNATRLLPVSEALGKQINEYWAKVPFQKIPNTVNTRLFYPAGNRNPHPFRYIHISTLLYPKNVEGIIHVFIKMLRKGIDVELTLVGPLNPSIKNLLTDEVGATGRIRTTGEIPYEQVGQEFRNADAMVMFSYYENMPCVILEALCSGVPVIATRVGGISEAIHPELGILVEAGNEGQLMEGMEKLMENFSYYENNLRNLNASGLYSYESVGKQILQVYEEVLANK